MTSVDEQDKYHHTKLDENKPRFSLIPPEVLEEIINVLEYGAKKYHVNSWKETPDLLVRDLDSAMRHIMSWQMKEIFDPETDLHHLAHAICQLMFMLWYEKQRIARSGAILNCEEEN